tara:strand:+ start:20926 stop:22014 length:1089 start_codon:yes stop_codon:yes gene_type:complete
LKTHRFVISGGGTGGHIYPALAIADELKKRFPNAEFLFIGAKDRMEMQRVPEAGYKIKGLWISGLQRKLTLRNLIFPFKLIFSVFKSYLILQRFKPTIAIGTGGFASGPLLLTASKLRIPYVLQEQNAFPGITNKWLASKAKMVFVAYTDMQRFFGNTPIKLTGNPVRSALIDNAIAKKEACHFFDLNPNNPIVVMLGGSLGSQRMNEWLAEYKTEFQTRNIQLIWQCGSRYINLYKAQTNDVIKVFDFITKMNVLFACADGFISRAGAGTISELSLIGKPILFIPSPNVAEDHQTKNAEAVVNHNAALMLKESEFKNDSLVKIELLIQHVKNVNSPIAINLKNIAKPEATKNIVNHISDLI